MRILHVSWEYPPVVYGGLGRHVAELAHAQTLLGHEVMVVTQSPVHREPRGDGPDGLAPAGGAFAEAWDDERVQVVREATALSERPGVDDLIRWVEHLDSELGASALRATRDWQPDVVHSHDWVTAGSGATLQAALGVPRVHTVHATEAGRHQGWLPHALSRTIDAIEQYAASEASTIITCSESMRREVIGLFGLDRRRPNGIPPERVEMIPNGIDLDDWTAEPASAAVARRRWLGEAAGPLIVQTGRLAWEKGAHLLIDAARELTGELPGLRVVIAGNGPYGEDLAEQVRAKGLTEIVQFAGWCAEADLAALMTAADAVVVPSYYEPFGLVAAEASALLTPVIAAQVGGLAELIRSGETGLTFPVGDYTALADRIREVAQDPAGADALAARARAYMADELTWGRIAGLTVAAYGRAAERGPRRTGELRLERRSGYVLGASPEPS